jgi:hypothetical protein
MARVRGLGFRCWSIAPGRTILLCMVVFLAVRSEGVLAQDSPKPKDEPVHTLHVYTNLIQIPTVVLGPSREQIKTPIAESRFSVSIDSGPWFRATHVRLEGDDAISLSILLDVSGNTAELMPKAGSAIAGLAPQFLHAKDHVSIYALDCSLVRSLDDMPAEKMRLEVAVDNALQSWATRRQNKHEPNCQQSVHLWDALAFIVGAMSKVPGRRVVLVVSDGKDRGSINPWNELRAYAQATGVAIFGMTDIPSYAMANRRMFPQSNSDDPFQALCELSGGMVMLTSAMSVEETMKRFTAVLRERYIVEFPRPANSTAGSHGMEVRVAKGAGDFIRSSGIAVPLPDPAVLADPTTVPSDPALTPEQGTRKVMTKPQ